MKFETTDGRSRPVEERFWEKVNKSAPNGCWEWTAGRGTGGYGMFWVNGRTVVAHRVCWAFHHGTIPDGMMVCHHCDNPPCVNPDHLFIGTGADNLADMTRKGRRILGESHPAAKLTADDVRRIRRYREEWPGLTQREVADQLGVTQSVIMQVVTGRRWRSVQ